MNEIYDLIVVGGGSAGCIAALTASQHGLKTLLIEKENILGGTSTISGVNCWEPSIGAGGVAFEFYRRMEQLNGNVGIYSLGRHCCDTSNNNPPFPGGEQIIDKDFSYIDTLYRNGEVLSNFTPELREKLHGVIFEPQVWHETMCDWLVENGNCTILLNTEIIEVETLKEKINNVKCKNNTYTAKFYIDCSGILVTLGNLPYLYGRDTKSMFNEQSAPLIADNNVNGVSRIFRITPCSMPKIENQDLNLSDHCFWSKNFPTMSCVNYPNGDKNCNMLPTFSGEEFQKIPPEERDKEGIKRVLTYWKYIQTNYPEFRFYRLHSIFPVSALRESIRTKCKYMLREQDVITGLKKQPHNDIIAIADHPLDIHCNKTSKKVEQKVVKVYGIPFRCLIPETMENLLVAGRIAGFSSIAASSCRLARTMMLLGEAAGLGAVESIKNNCTISEIDVQNIQAKLHCLKIENSENSANLK